MNRQMSEYEEEVLMYIINSKPIAMSVNKKIRWWSFGIPVRDKIYPTLDEQLRAILELSGFESKTAKKFLERLCEKSEWSESVDPANGCGDANGSFYPNTNGELFKALNYVSAGSESRHSSYEHPRRKEAERILNSSLS